MKRTKQKNMRRILPVFFVQLLLVVAAYAQAKRPMTPEDVVSLNRASDAQMSPDARRVAFVVSSWDRENDRFNSDIWMVDELRQAIRLTSNPKRDDSPRWSPDARRLAFLSERGSDAEAGAQIFLLNPVGGEPVQLTSHKAPIQSFEWSPDGRLIAFIAEEARERSRTKPPVVVDEDHRFAQLKQITKGGGAENQPRFSPDGRLISYLARSDGDANVGPERIHVVAATGGESRALAQTFDGYISSYRWVFDSQRVIFLAAMGVSANLYTMRVADPNPAPTLMTVNEGVTTGFSMTVDGMNIAYVHESPRMPTEVALLNARNMIPILLTRLNPQVESLTLGLVEPVKWKSNDGTEVEGLLVYPVGYQTGARYPLLTYIHGGPEGAY